MIVKIFFLILATILSLFQTTILSINLLLLLVIMAAFYQTDFSFLFAFVSGLILDSAKGETIGVSSVKFLLLAFLIFLLKIRLPIREKRQLKLPQI